MGNDDNINTKVRTQTQKVRINYKLSFEYSSILQVEWIDSWENVANFMNREG